MDLSVCGDNIFIKTELEIQPIGGKTITIKPTDEFMISFIDMRNRITELERKIYEFERSKQGIN